MKRLNLSICVITDSVPELDRTHLQVAAAAIRGGATMIQYRDKTVGDEEFAETALMLLALTRAAGIPLIINDRVSIAIAVGADGVHIGSEDGDADEVRRSLPEEMCLGVSATDYEEALALSATGADYLGVGPVFPTVSKIDAKSALGTKELARICGAVRTPVLAIGGINRENLPKVLDAGVSGIAVISAVTHATDMAAAVSELRTLWHCQRGEGERVGAEHLYP